MGVECVGQTCWGARVVEDGYNEVVGAVVVEWGVQHNVVPPFAVVDVADKHLSHLAERHGADRVVETVEVGVCHVDGAVGFVECV